jgi:hypothetical protein
MLVQAELAALRSAARSARTLVAELIEAGSATLSQQLLAVQLAQVADDIGFNAAEFARKIPGVQAGATPGPGCGQEL